MKSYSVNDELYWPTVDDAIDCLDLEDIVGETITIWEAPTEHYDVTDMAFANVLVDLMLENAFDDLGEETAMDWCDQVNNLDTAELQKNLKQIFGNWLRDNRCDRDFFTISGKPQEMQIRITEDGWEEV